MVLVSAVYRVEEVGQSHGLTEIFRLKTSHYATGPIADWQRTALLFPLFFHQKAGHALAAWRAQNTIIPDPPEPDARNTPTKPPPPFASNDEFADFESLRAPSAG